MIKKVALLSTLGLLFAVNVFASSGLGKLQESVQAGKTISIGLNPSSTGNWYVGQNTNSGVLTGNISSGSLLITGKSIGTASIYACTDSQLTDCLQVDVTVTATGNVLGAAIQAPHPAGSWVQNGQTVFYINANGIIPITTWQIFLSNGGRQSLIQPANNSDLSLPLQTLMTLKDSRVSK